MLHTKLFSPTRKLFFSEVSEQSNVGKKLTLTEETKKALEDRISLQDNQKKEINDFLKSISWSNGKIRPTLTEEQKSTLKFLLKVINVQQKENEILDSKTIADKVAIIGQTQEALKIERPRKIEDIRTQEQIKQVRDIMGKVIVSGEKKDFSKLTLQEKVTIANLFKDLRPYLPINEGVVILDFRNDERLEISYDAIKLALKELDASDKVVVPSETPVESISLKELLMGDPNEVLYSWKPDVLPTPKEKVIITAIQKKLIELGLRGRPSTVASFGTYLEQDYSAIQSVMPGSDPHVIRRGFVNKLLGMGEELPQKQPKETSTFSIDTLRKGDMKEVLIKKGLKISEVNEPQKMLIIEVQKKLMELGYLEKVPDSDLGTFGNLTEKAIARFLKQNNIDGNSIELTRGVALAILDSRVSKIKNVELEVITEEIIAKKLEKGAEKIPNENVRKVQKLLKSLDKDYQGGEDGLFGDKTEESLKRVLKLYFKDETTDTKIITKSLIVRLEAEEKKISKLQRGNIQPVPVKLPRTKPISVQGEEVPLPSRSGLDSTSLVPEKNFFEKIFNFSEDLETSKFNGLRTKIESTISAKSGLDTLEKQIFAISNTLDKNKIETVYVFAQQELGKKGIQLDSSLSPIEKAYVLQLVANALMGGKSMVERREKNRTNIKEYIQADKSQAKDADRLFAQTFSGTMVKDISAARNLAYQELLKKGVYQEIFLNNESGTYIFSVRSKTGMNGLQGYVAGSGEMVDVGVPYVRITEFEKKDVQKLISTLNPVQLTLLRQQLKPAYGVLSDTQIMNLLVSGEKVGPQFIVHTQQGDITIDLTFSKGGNCFNDAVGLHIELPAVYLNHTRNGRDGGHDSHNGGQTSTPGHHGGGTDGGGNGTPGPGGNGRT